MKQSSNQVEQSAIGSIINESQGQVEGGSAGAVSLSSSNSRTSDPQAQALQDQIAEENQGSIDQLGNNRQVPYDQGDPQAMRKKQK